MKKDCPDLGFEPGLQVLVGMLVVPLSLNGVDFLVFFRKAKAKEILWAGNPNEKISRPGSAYLEPRSSFRRWTEQVVGTSREWTEDQGLSNFYFRTRDEILDGLSLELRHSRSVIGR